MVKMTSKKKTTYLAGFFSDLSDMFGAMGGVEPPLLAQHAPQACVSTISPHRRINVYLGISVGSDSLVAGTEGAAEVEDPIGTSTGAEVSLATGAVIAVGIIDSPIAPSGCATNQANMSEFEKNTTANKVVSFVKKFPEPFEPNTVPDAPPPNAAPASAPLPC